MKYKIFVIDADGEDCVYQSDEYEIQDGWLKIIDGKLMFDVGGLGDAETVVFPPNRVREIDYIN